MMKATSKKTGIAIIKPVIIKAQEAPFSPVCFSKKEAIASAPPECSKIAPNMAPRPTTTATKPSVFPIPVCMVLTMLRGSIPAMIPTMILAMSRAIKAWILNFRIKINKIAIPEKIAMSKVLSNGFPICTVTSFLIGTHIGMSAKIIALRLD